MAESNCLPRKLLTNARVIHELGGVFSKVGIPWSEDRMSPSMLAHIISLVLSGKITNNSAKKLLWILFEDNTRDIETTIQHENMIVQDIGDHVYAALAQELTESNPDMVKAIKEKGQKGKIMWFVGQMMKEMSKTSGGGGASPEKSKAAVLHSLGLPS